MKRTKAEDDQWMPPASNSGMWIGWGNVLTKQNKHLKEQVALLEKQRRKLIKLVNLLLK